MTDFSVSGPYGMYHAVIIVKDQFLSNGVVGSLSDYTAVVDDPSYVWPNHEGDKRVRMLELVGSTCTSSNKSALRNRAKLVLTKPFGTSPLSRALSRFWSSGKRRLFIKLKDI